MGMEKPKVDAKVLPPSCAIDAASSRLAGRKTKLGLVVGFGVDGLEDSHWVLVSCRGAGVDVAAGVGKEVSVSLRVVFGSSGVDGDGETGERERGGSGGWTRCWTSIISTKSIASFRDECWNVAVMMTVLRAPKVRCKAAYIFRLTQRSETNSYTIPPTSYHSLD